MQSLSNTYVVCANISRLDNDLSTGVIFNDLISPCGVIRDKDDVRQTPRWFYFGREVSIVLGAVHSGFSPYPSQQHPDSLRAIEALHRAVRAAKRSLSILIDIFNALKSSAQFTPIILIAKVFTHMLIPIIYTVNWGVIC